MGSNRTPSVVILILATVLSGTFCKEKTAQLPSLDYQDATVPEDFKNVSQGDNRETLLLPSNGETVSTNTSSVLRAATVDSVPTKVDKVLEVSTTTAPIEVESQYINEESNNSTKKRTHTIIDPVSVKLLRGETNGITVTDMALSDPILFFNYTQAKAYSVDYHYAKKTIFFTSLGVILRNDVMGRLTRTGKPKLVVSDWVEGPTRLAVDWVHDKVYWMSDTHQTVEVAGLDGDNRTLLFDNLQRFRFPNNIAIDPYAGYLFLVSNYSMFRAHLDGTNLTRLQMEGEVTRGVKCLALDTCKRRVYYSGKEGGLETGTPYIASCDYDGGSVQDHPLAYKWNDIFSLDVFRDTIYFAHYSKLGPDTLYSADLTKTKLTPVWLQTADPASGGIWSVRVYHPGVQQNPRGNNCLEKSENFNRGA